MKANVIYFDNQNFVNLNKALNNFKTRDKTIIKIIKFIPNIIKLIGAFIMDISRAFFNIFTKKTNPSVEQPSDKSNSIIKNIWNNHKGKFIVLGIGVLALVGFNLINYSIVIDQNNNKTIPSVWQAKNGLKKAFEDYKLAYCNSLGKVHNNIYGPTKEPYYIEPHCELYRPRHFDDYACLRKIEKFVGIELSLKEKCWTIQDKIGGYQIKNLLECFSNPGNYSNYLSNLV